MSLTEFFANVRRYDKNAEVIFDRDEPVGRPTDLVMPWRPWWGRRAGKSISPQMDAATKDS